MYLRLWFVTYLENIWSIIYSQKPKWFSRKELGKRNTKFFKSGTSRYFLHTIIAELCTIQIKNFQIILLAVYKDHYCSKTMIKCVCKIHLMEDGSLLIHMYFFTKN